MKKIPTIKALRELRARAGRSYVDDNSLLQARNAVEAWENILPGEVQDLIDMLTDTTHPAEKPALSEREQAMQVVIDGLRGQTACIDGLRDRIRGLEADLKGIEEDKQDYKRAWKEATEGIIRLTDRLSRLAELVDKDTLLRAYLDT